VSTSTEWNSLRRRLEALAQSVAAEIQTYPRPITACDAQFNHLLELRRVMPFELERLDIAAADPRSRVEDFVRSSPCQAALSEPVRHG
jgi:hypothetical protein